LLGLAAASAGCSLDSWAPVRVEASSSIVASRQALKEIRHITPAPDSSGGTPSRFEWTAVEGADRYAISVWNEVDATIWQVNDLREPRVAWPEGFRVEMGTYFWAVAALKGDRPVGESGRAAFVVLR
jgi:hypothetical protein